jgi:hypothetical protein
MGLTCRQVKNGELYLLPIHLCLEGISSVPVVSLLVEKLILSGATGQQLLHKRRP